LNSNDPIVKYKSKKEIETMDYICKGCRGGNDEFDNFHKNLENFEKNGNSKTFDYVEI